MHLSDAYRVLEVPPGASKQTAREARNLLAKVWHPDRHQGDQKVGARAEEKLKEINEAYALLESRGFPKQVETAQADPTPAQGPHRAPNQSADASARGSDRPHGDSPRTPPNTDEGNKPREPPGREQPRYEPPAAPQDEPSRNKSGAKPIVAVAVVAVVVMIVAWSRRADHDQPTTRSFEPAPSYSPPEPPQQPPPTNADKPSELTPPTHAMEERLPAPAVVPTKEAPAKPQVKRQPRAIRQTNEQPGPNPTPTGRPPEKRSFAIGSVASDVLAAQGKPDQIIQPDFNTEVWQYGSSTVTLRSGVVREYSNMGALNVR